MEDIEFVGTDELITELTRRFDVCVLSGYKTLSTLENGVTMRFHGPHPAVLGLLKLSEVETLADFERRYQNKNEEEE